ncbi:MAG TPA: H-X9-DG-CTERM domain-containing protein [Verrucomicrobiae bacterium]
MKTKPARSILGMQGNLTSPAFTLVELLVVVAIIGILSSLLLSSLAQAKARGKTISCLNNEKQLILACLLYTHDSEDALPYNMGDDQTLRLVQQGQYLNWVNNVMSWDTDPNNTNTTLLMTGGLGPYLSGTPQVYRCPSDNVLSDLQRAAGWRSRDRSYSMNAMVGDAGDFSTNGANVNNPFYKQFFHLTQIPDPTQIFVFVEEHPDSIDDGYFLNRAETYEWRDLPGSYHNGGANLAFADGHIEYHQWNDGSTKAPSVPYTLNLPFHVKPTGVADYHWLMDRTSLKGPAILHSYP